MRIDVRQANIGDAEAISCLGAVTFAHAYGAIVRPEDMAGYTERMFAVSRIEQEITRKQATYFIALTMEEVVGYARIVATQTPDSIDENVVGKSIELVRLYIDERYYGKRIGEQLLQQLTVHVIDSGYQTLWLRVWEKNMGAIRFYQRHGFKVVGREPYLIGKTANPVALMVKTLLIQRSQ